ncbi:MAG: putative toxin-antitoxin system toxin component, PIN family [Betaproteobacteria bacterium]|nr:putative toxin-antitoxin system toxin component, PIN family [Betaproteobacteria bacterium]
MRLVLDTNVVLDLFYWRDPALAELSSALEAGRCLCLADAQTMGELERVLELFEGAERRKNTASPREALAAYRALVVLEDSGEQEAEAMSALPRCRDSDDQKFLELALRSHASYLVTRDRELLRLERFLKREDRKGNRAGFCVLSPAALLPLLAPTAG